MFVLSFLDWVSLPYLYLSISFCQDSLKCHFLTQESFWILQLEEISFFWHWWDFVHYCLCLLILSHSALLQLLDILFQYPQLNVWLIILSTADCPDTWINCFAFMSPSRRPEATQDQFEWRWGQTYRLVCPVSSEPEPHQAEVMDGHHVAQRPWLCDPNWISFWDPTSNICLANMGPHLQVIHLRRIQKLRKYLMG